MDPANLVPALTTMDNLPANVRNELVRLSAQNQAEFVEEYTSKSKSTGNAYVFWLFLGSHYVYLRKWDIQIFFWWTVGGFLFWWFVDCFVFPA